MRFLTLDWWAGGMEDGECDAAKAASQTHFESVRDRLPPQLLALFESYGLHDGRLLSLRTDTERKTAELVIDAWNNFNGDYPVLYTLHFSDVASVEVNGGRLNDRCQTGGLHDLGYYEVDVLKDGHFRLDFLFWSGFEIGIVFEAIEVTAVEQASAV